MGRLIFRLSESMQRGIISDLVCRALVQLNSRPVVEDWIGRYKISCEQVIGMSRYIHRLPFPASSLNIMIHATRLK
jgi:hypothetical protein